MLSSNAAKWYRKAAEQGDADAQFNLGDMSNTGEGVTKDRSEARKWYRKAANQGQADAQRQILKG
jgi:TPR repeat protein